MTKIRKIEIELNDKMSEKDIINKVLEAVGKDKEEAVENRFTVAAQSTGLNEYETSVDVCGNTGEILSMAVGSFAYFLSGLTGMDKEVIDLFTERLNRLAKDYLDLEQGEE